MNKKVIILGGGGHSLSCIDILQTNSRYKVLGVIDKSPDVDLCRRGYEYLGNDTLIKDYINENNIFLIAIGQIKDPSPRQSLFEKLTKLDADILSLTSQNAIISKNATTGIGTAVFHKVVIGYGASIDENTIINTGSIIEHGVTVGQHCHIAPNSTVLGNAKIGNRCFIGANSVIFPNVTITDNAIIGAGSIIKKDFKAGKTSI